MEKGIVREEVNFYFDWTYDVSIEKLREDLDELEKLGATSVYIEAVEGYGSAYVDIKAYKSRMETDEEFEARVNVAERAKKTQEQRELEEYERLKKKYGK